MNDFKEEILTIIQNLKEKGSYQANSYLTEQETAAEEAFKQELLESLANGNTRLAAGGNGLEQLIKELVEIEGYTKVRIEAKNQSSDISDIDISAEKNDRFNNSRLLIQAKHHRGQTSSHGLRQLITHETDDDESNVQKWLMTTGSLSSESKKLAEEHNIRVMEGKDLVEWISESLEHLSPATKQKLGIIEVPKIVKLK
ncbi:restriction endonuclease [Neisseria chenwenguii]|uniref:restriction endonuclease n=1 Tax=Neisseria chenwenguii TaxID=1853278 RepID=UPI0018E06111|nr:restriction endonuclease [Neisseria chenwenguii]